MILKCPNEFGIYDNKIYLNFPNQMFKEKGGYYHSKEGALIDVCIVSEIKRLWDDGVRTYGSCCGHGILDPAVNVDEEDFEKMEKLGYKKLDNESNNYTYKLKSNHRHRHLLI